MSGLKKCPKCGQVLPDKMFAATTKWCKTCRRNYDWQYRYGISPEQYFDLYTQQEGRCKICGAEMKEGHYLRVDHCAKTGEVRGLLCDNCNKALGLFRDSPDNLRQAIRYLEEIHHE